MQTRFISTTDSLLVGNYEFYIPNKGQVDATLSVFWSLYAEELGLYTTLQGSNVPVLVVGNSQSVFVEDFSNSPTKNNRVIKIAILEGIPFSVTVKGHLPNGMIKPQPTILISSKDALNLDSEILQSAKEDCLKLYEKAYAYSRSKGLVLAEAEFKLVLDEYGDLYFTGEMLTPNKATYWNFLEMSTSSPMPFHLQPALSIINNCRTGRLSYNGQTINKIQDRTTVQYGCLCQRLVG